MGEAPSGDFVMYVEWDEPGAGGFVINGKRVISFSIDTDWSEAWNPQVHQDALRFIDALPRLVQERELAYLTAQECEAAMVAAVADNATVRRALDRHNLWCGFNKDAPGDSSFNEAMGTERHHIAPPSGGRSVS